MTKTIPQIILLLGYCFTTRLRIAKGVLDYSAGWS